MSLYPTARAFARRRSFEEEVVKSHTALIKITEGGQRELHKDLVHYGLIRVDIINRLWSEVKQQNKGE